MHVWDGAVSFVEFGRRVAERRARPYHTVASLALLTGGIGRVAGDAKSLPHIGSVGRTAFQFPTREYNPTRKEVATQCGGVCPHAVTSICDIYKLARKR